MLICFCFCFFLLVFKSGPGKRGRHSVSVIFISERKVSRRSCVLWDGKWKIPTCSGPTEFLPGSIPLLDVGKRFFFGGRLHLACAGLPNILILLMKRNPLCGVQVSFARALVPSLSFGF